MISARTKAVLAAAKRRGVTLGRDPWGSIDGQGTSNWWGTGAQPAMAGCRAARPRSWSLDTLLKKLRVLPYV